MVWEDERIDGERGEKRGNGKGEGETNVSGIYMNCGSTEGDVSKWW